MWGYRHRSLYIIQMKKYNIPTTVYFYRFCETLFEPHIITSSFTFQSAFITFINVVWALYSYVCVLSRLFAFPKNISWIVSKTAIALHLQTTNATSYHQVIYEQLAHTIAYEDCLWGNPVHCPASSLFRQFGECTVVSIIAYSWTEWVHRLYTTIVWCISQCMNYTHYSCRWWYYINVKKTVETKGTCFSKEKLLGKWSSECWLLLLIHSERCKKAQVSDLTALSSCCSSAQKVFHGFGSRFGLSNHTDDDVTLPNPQPLPVRVHIQTR